MKIVVCTSALAFEQPGGAEVYLINLVKEINRIGRREAVMDFYDPTKHSMKEYDIALFFNSAAYNVLAYDFLSRAKAHGLGTINVPVYFSIHNLFKGIERILFKIGLFLVRAYTPRIGPILRSKLEYFYLSLNIADMILVSGFQEMKAINKDFAIPEIKMHILPIAVEDRFANSTPDLFMEKYGVEECILYVGRIEQRKNVLRLVKAYDIAQIDAPLVIIGPVKERDYYEQILTYVANNNLSKKVLIIPGINHENPLLASAYATARVFVLPSFYETPGIAALEAALAGANIVITKYGTTQEYFGNYALYVDPFNITDIAKKLKIACTKPRPNVELREYVLRNFTYRSVAKKFLELIKLLVEESDLK